MNFCSVVFYNSALITRCEESVGSYKKNIMHYYYTYDIYVMRQTKKWELILHTKQLILSYYFSCNYLSNSNKHVYPFLTFFYIRRRKNWFCANFWFPVFDGFKRFEMSWTLFDFFWKTSVCLCVCLYVCLCVCLCVCVKNYVCKHLCVQV